MATNWVKAQAVVPTAVATAAQTASVSAPVALSLLTTQVWFETSSAGPATSFAITDNSTGQGPWSSMGAIQTSGTYAAQSFYKISDGTETSVTSTGAGYSTSIESHRMQVVNYTVTGGGSIALDLAVASVATGASISVSPLYGSSQPSNTDELALIYYGLLGSVETATSASFTGTSALAAAALASSSNIVFDCYYVGGVQASATAATNVFKAAVGGSSTFGYSCATFYYTSSTPSTAPVAILWGQMGMSQAVNRSVTF